MSKKKISKVVQHRLSILFPLSIFIFVTCLWTVGSYAYNIYSLKKEEAALREELKNLTNEEESLNDEIIKLKDPDYIAKYARENYFYTKKGEYVIKINEVEKEREAVIKENTNKAYYLIGVSGCLLIMLIFILYRKRKK